MQFFPGSPQVSVGAAVEAHGAEFFRLASLTAPCAVDGVINVQQYPVIPNCNPQNLCPPGTFDIAVTPDGEYAFVANEYGLMPSPTPTTEKGGGTIGVIRLERDDFGRFTMGSQVGTIYVPGGNTIPGITMSHDGKYLYVTCEGSADGINPQTFNPYRDPTNVRSTPNGPVLCPGCVTNAKKCDNESKGIFQNNGLLTVIDVAKATSGMGQASIIMSIASGCSPVRAVETENGQYLFVAARGLNKELPPQQGTSGYQFWLSMSRSWCRGAASAILVSIPVARPRHRGLSPRRGRAPAQILQTTHWLDKGIAVAPLLWAWRYLATTITCSPWQIPIGFTTTANA
jgi:DNA-binding beta-propeller fold protein YncE